MERKGISIYNVIGRVTHGLIGLDIYVNQKRNTEYLKDFLTLDEQEMRAAFLSITSENELIPHREGKLPEKAEEFIKCVKETQKLVQKIGKIDSTKEIKQSLDSLEKKMDIIYASVPEP